MSDLEQVRALIEKWRRLGELCGSDPTDQRAAILYALLADELEALLPLLASKDEVAPYEQLYNRVMSLLRATKMEHGLCEPRSRRACTHCNAVEELDKMLSEYKGARVIASNFRYQQIEGGGAVYTDDKPIEE